jgi:hypothetical protein
MVIAVPVGIVYSTLSIPVGEITRPTFLVAKFAGGGYLREIIHTICMEVSVQQHQ